MVVWGGFTNNCEKKRRKKQRRKGKIFPFECRVPKNREWRRLFWESLGLQGESTSPSWRRSVLGVHWKDWCLSTNSSTLATSCEELTHWKIHWCWEGLGAGGEGDDREWDGWVASPTGWAWVWINSGSWWWTGRPGMLWFMGSQRVRHDWATELNWTEDREWPHIDNNARAKEKNYYSDVS